MDNPEQIKITIAKTTKEKLDSLCLSLGLKRSAVITNAINLYLQSEFEKSSLKILDFRGEENLD